MQPTLKHSSITMIFALLAFFSLSGLVFLISYNGNILAHLLHAKPTVIIIPGRSLTIKDYDYLVDTLKAHHYPVVAFESTYQNSDQYEDMVKEWKAELDTVAPNKNVVVIGHSVGGATAAEYCSTEVRCLAGVNMDGGLKKEIKINVPFLYLQGGLGDYCDEECIAGRKIMEEVAHDSNIQVVNLPDIKHYNFTDYHSEELIKEGLMTNVDAHQTISETIINFLDTKLQR